MEMDELFCPELRWGDIKGNELWDKTAHEETSMKMAGIGSGYLPPINLPSLNV